jgi:hypothetical protein
MRGGRSCVGPGGGLASLQRHLWCQTCHIGAFKGRFGGWSHAVDATPAASSGPRPGNSARVDQLVGLKAPDRTPVDQLAPKCAADRLSPAFDSLLFAHSWLVMRGGPGWRWFGARTFGGWPDGSFPPGAPMTKPKQMPNTLFTAPSVFLLSMRCCVDPWSRQSNGALLLGVKPLG